MAKKSGFMMGINNIISYLHNSTKALNQSKIFAGLMIIIINIASKFVTFKVSKTVESYLKFTFSRNVLVFAGTWMGTRDIYVALFITLLFIFVVDFLFNEASMFCCLPKSYTNIQVAKLEGMENLIPSADEVARAEIVLAKAKNTRPQEFMQEEIDTSAYVKVDTNLMGYTN